MEETIETRRCKVCGEVKPVTEFYCNFYKQVGCSYYSSYCKECKCRIKREKYRAKRKVLKEEKIKEQAERAEQVNSPRLLAFKHLEKLEQAGVDLNDA